MSKSFSRPLKYKGFIRNPLTVREIEIIYRQNRVQPVRVELYSDFVQSLCDLIFMSYLGDNHHTKSNHKLEHFLWCWNENLDVFRRLGYKLKNEKKKFDYFQSFFLDVFYYSNEDKDEVLENSIKNVWCYIFDYNVVKSKWDVENFLDIYKMFEETDWYK